LPLGWLAGALPGLPLPVRGLLALAAGGRRVVPARRLPGLLRSLPPSLTPERAREVAAQINRRLDAPTAR
jgi:hypothetical protein